MGGFYNKCQVDDNDKFVVLPVMPWVEAEGPSFGFKLSGGGVSLCMTPQPPVPGTP